MSILLLEKIIDTYFAFIPRHKPSIEVFESSQLIAHRGAHNQAQGVIENTLVAFNLAQNLGCWGIEFDVRATADGVLVVNHDATLKRIWGYDHEIAHLSFKKLRTLVPDIPTLEEVVTAYGNHMHLFIELKTPFQDEEVLVRTLHGLSPGEQYHLLTLDSAIFYSLTQVPKSTLLLVAGIKNAAEFCNISFRENYGGVLGHYFLITDKILDRLITNKSSVGVGMVNSRNSLYRELNRGINWIFTDRAVEMSAILSS